MKNTRTLQLANGGLQLYFGLEKASHASNGCKMEIFFQEPCGTVWTFWTPGVEADPIRTKFQHFAQTPRGGFLWFVPRTLP